MFAMIYNVKMYGQLRGLENKLNRYGRNNFKKNV